TTARYLASTDAAPAAEDLVPALTAALPEPVSEVIVQADLTILAPGPLVPDLAAEFALLADVESAGAATTYRIPETSLRRALPRVALAPAPAAAFARLADAEPARAASTSRITATPLRRALDAGRTDAGIRDLLSRTSITPVPQSLDYLIRDVARRHGRLRVG